MQTVKNSGKQHGLRVRSLEKSWIPCLHSPRRPNGRYKQGDLMNLLLNDMMRRNVVQPRFLPSCTAGNHTLKPEIGQSWVKQVFFKGGLSWGAQHAIPQKVTASGDHRFEHHIKFSHHTTDWGITVTTCVLLAGINSVLLAQSLTFRPLGLWRTSMDSPKPWWTTLMR